MKRGDDNYWVKSFCATGKDDTDIEKLVSDDSWFRNIGTNNLEFEFDFVFPTIPDGAYAALVGCSSLGSGQRWTILAERPSGGVNRMLLVYSSLTSGGVFLTSSAAITTGNIYNIKVVFDRTSSVNVLMNGVQIITNNISSWASDNWQAIYDFRVLAYGSTTNTVTDAIPPRDTKIWNLRVKIGDEEVRYPLQGSGYDVGNLGKHLTINPDGVEFIQDQDDYHYNITYGFDLWEEDDGDNYIYVPYRNGVPVVETVAGYTKLTENPAGYWHNMAETLIRLEDYDEFDRSDVSLWNADCRASIYYDSDNPNDWWGSELSPYTLATYATAELRNKIFSRSTANEYVEDEGQPVVENFESSLNLVVDNLEPLTKVKNVMYFEEAQTETLLKLWKFIKQKGD